MGRLWREQDGCKEGRRSGLHVGFTWSLCDEGRVLLLLHLFGYAVVFLFSIIVCTARALLVHVEVLVMLLSDVAQVYRKLLRSKYEFALPVGK